MGSLIVALHIIVCVLLILVVLLQAGKGAEAGATLGMGGSQTVFGSGGAAPFLTKLTTVVAVIFMLTSIGLTILSSKESKETVIDSIGVAEPLSTLPAIPATKPSDESSKPKK
jgi:preprotein translocase subunit SecG